MTKTSEFEFDRKGRITLFGSADAIKVLSECVAIARRNHTTRPKKWRWIPTLTDSV